MGLFVAGVGTAGAGEVCQPRWDTDIGVPGMDHESPSQIAIVHALAVFEDGSGPALYAGGLFTSAGGVPANNIARWDGEQWSALGGGTDGRVRSLVVFDDGTGPALYAGGSFTVAGGVRVNHIARWDGEQWSALGEGTDQWVSSALVVFDDGSGPVLYAGGGFTMAGGGPASRIARWDGRQWSALDTGMNDSLLGLSVFDDGTGPALHAGGFFTMAGGASANRIARWDGEKWSALGSGMNDYVRALTVFDDGTGPARYVGGVFIAAGTVSASRVARWDGAEWHALGSGITAGSGTCFPTGVRTMIEYDGELILGGCFTGAGGLTARFIARWDGETFAALGTGLNRSVRALAVFNDDLGRVPGLFAGGALTGIGTVSTCAPANRIARWGCIDDGQVFGDLNGDGSIGVADLLLLISEWGDCPLCPGPNADACFADLNGDGVVDLTDLLLLISNWN